MEAGKTVFSFGGGANEEFSGATARLMRTDCGWEGNKGLISYLLLGRTFLG